LESDGALFFHVNGHGSESGLGEKKQLFNPLPLVIKMTDRRPEPQVVDGGSIGLNSLKHILNCIVYWILKKKRIIFISNPSHMSIARALPLPIVVADEHDFGVQLHFPQSFRSVINSVLEVSREVEVQVVDGSLRRKPEFRGLVVEAKSDVCMIVAYLSGEVKLAADADSSRTHFYVSTVTLHTCLKSVTSTQEVRIARSPGNHDFELRMQEPHPSNASSTFRLPTLNKKFDGRRLDEMRFDYAVEFEMPQFRSVIKTARDLRAERVRLRVIETAGEPRFVVSCDGDAAVQHTFESVARMSEDTDTHPGDVVKFDDEFSAEYLHVFIKSVDKSTVSMQIAQGKPLLMSYTLGDLQSSMSFILVPYSCME
jgi:hypothetical protein